MLRFVLVGLVGLLVTAVFHENFALPRKAQADYLSRRALLPVSEVWEVTVSSRKITCGGPVNGKYLSGSVQSVLNGYLFTPASEKVKKLKVQYKKASPSLRLKLKKKINALSGKVKSDDGYCAYGPDEPPPLEPTPPPSATPTPRPDGNFDSNGNVTAAGKIAFGIPSNLNANRENGRSIWNASCAGCHSTENQGRSFSTYKITIQSAPMFIFDKSDQDIAHLTAYLNRFKVN